MDRGYRGHGESSSEVYISGHNHAVGEAKSETSTKRLNQSYHLRCDGLLGRNHLKGTLGDQMNVLLSCAGHNLRLVLKHLSIFCPYYLGRYWR